MAAELRQVDPDVTFDMVESGGGVFEVSVDGKLIFSKKGLGRFPNKGEVATLFKG